MPFATTQMPSIQIGVMAATAERAGHVAHSYHLNLDLAGPIGLELYEALCDHRGRLTGEGLFAVAAFEDERRMNTDYQPADPGAEYLDAFAEEQEWFQSNFDMTRSEVLTLRSQVIPAYIERCAAGVSWGSYDVVGFTSTFQQNVASLALARRIKGQCPGLTVVFGGANMEAEMGPAYVSAFPFIDYAVVGEGDHTFPDLLGRLAAGENASDVSGVAARAADGSVEVGSRAPLVRDMDALPTPNYEAYFERAARLEIPTSGRLPFESSRGCWWGQKHHCTFCGLNGSGMTHRSKSADRLVAELDELARRHGVTAFDATDNVLDLRYLKTLFPALAERRTDFEFFYEVKANLSPADIRTLFMGGVRRIQPGIESMSTALLRLMRKGSSMLQNVRLLKWSRYYGLRVDWNLLYGFPGERAQDYSEQLGVLRLLSHLEPPVGHGRLWLERFSPYFRQRGEYPIRNVRPEGSYAFTYPDIVDLERAAYFFEYEMDDVAPAEVHEETALWLRDWRRRWESAEPDTLSYRRVPGAILVDDRRARSVAITYVFDGPLGLVYEFCSETMRTAKDIQTHLRGHDAVYAIDDVRGALAEMCAAGLMVCEAERHLSLALPTNPNW